jgi:ParB family chromosome partitioning protein
MEVRNIPIDSIRPDPNQPRKVFSDEHIEGLAESLKIEGMINPIEIDGNDTIITGECRWRAAKKVGWSEVPAIINAKGINEYERFRRQMAENLHQSPAGGASPMNALDVARGYRKMLQMKGGWRSGPEHPPYEEKGISELARELAISKSVISDYLALLDEPKNVLEEIIKGRPKAFYTELRGVPEKYKEGLREAISEDKITSSKDIRRFRQLAKQRPQKAELLFLKITERQSEDANRVLNRTVELGLALTQSHPEKFSLQDREMVAVQLNSLAGVVRQYVGKLRKINKLNAVEGKIEE